MAKIKDLGINVIPETMRPPEVGAGGCGNTFQQAGAGCCPVTCNVTTAFCPCTVTTWFQQEQMHPQTMAACCPITCQVTTGVQHLWPPAPTACCPRTCNVTTTQTGLTIRDWVAQLKEQFQQQIAQLEEYEKAMGPRTAEEMDAREKELKEELAELAARRKELKKK